MSLRKYEREELLCATFWVSSSDYVLVHYFSLVSDSLSTFFTINCCIWHFPGNMAGWFLTLTFASSKKLTTLKVEVYLKKKKKRQPH